MKRAIFLSILFIFAPCLCYAETKYAKTIYEYYDTGETHCIINVIDTSLLESDTYSTELFQGNRKRYRKDGLIRGEDSGTYEGRSIELCMLSDGVARYYANVVIEDTNIRIYGWERLLFIERYKDGQLEGISEDYYENGKLKSEINYKAGERDGIIKYYYESGMLFSEEIYKADKREGISKEYYEKDGMYFHIDTYKDDRLIKRKQFNEDGKLEFEQDY